MDCVNVYVALHLALAIEAQASQHVESMESVNPNSFQAARVSGRSR
jgi:hypothetical protein